VFGQFFPPVTEQGLQNLLDRVERMSKLSPSWFSITWGAGGTTQERSLLLADEVQKRTGVSACMHLTCTNMEKSKLDETLEVSHTLARDAAHSQT
jgi:methylenetetrahydrofolate reductase (NADPH)